jgi:cytochrome d ubiquinol oxidase subunit I
MVAIGTLFSSFWILSANSWMQTPAGFEIEDDGRFFPISWLAIVFSPSFPYRLAHNVSAFYVTTGFVVLGVGAYLFRRGSSVEEARRMVLMALGFLALFVPLQIALGDLHGLNTRDYQPAKLAAIEARWETTAPVPLTLFAIPDQQGERNLYAIDIPYLGSLILTHSLNGGIKGLKQWPPDERPPVWPVFFAFRVMVGIGLVMLVVVSLGWFLWIRGQLFETGWFLRLCQWTAPLGFVAVLAGWITTDGRPAALDRVRIDAHGGICFAVPDRVRRAFVAPGLCRCLSLDVPSGTRGNGTLGAAGSDRGRRDTHTG